METSGFNLQQSIDSYISVIKNQGSITGSDAAELTAHLFDATDFLRGQGLSEEEAFLIARKRLGEEAVLTEEYSKINTSVKTNKVWAYMFIGVNVFFSIPALTLGLLAASNLYVFKAFGDSAPGALIITACHIVFCVLVWAVVLNKRRISYFIENQVEMNPVRISCLSFIPMAAMFVINTAFYSIDQSNILSRYPLSGFSGSIPEFSFYLVLLSMGAAGLCLLFSIDKIGRLTSKSLFEKPSVLFLVLIGLLVEFLAASTRIIQMESMVGSAIIFGSVYMLLSFLITFNNSKVDVNKYLLIATALGLCLELAVGIDADLDRGDTYNTAFYVSASIILIIAGRYLGIRFREGNNLVQNL